MYRDINHERLKKTELRTVNESNKDDMLILDNPT